MIRSTASGCSRFRNPLVGEIRFAENNIHSWVDSWVPTSQTSLDIPHPSPSSSKADEEALRKFVVDVVGEKYWPVFEREEIDDLKTLKCCTARDLQDMKIPLGPRLKLLSNLEGLAA